MTSDNLKMKGNLNFRAVILPQRIVVTFGSFLVTLSASVFFANDWKI